jgi:hypothetical protein
VTSLQKQHVSGGVIKQGVWNECGNVFELNLDWLHLLGHPFMHFSNNSVRQVVCVMGKFHLLHNVWTQLDFKLDICRTHSANVEHLWMVKINIDIWNVMSKHLYIIFHDHFQFWNYNHVCLALYHFFSWRMVSSGVLRRAALVRTDVSEEPSASFIRVTRIGELGTTLAATSNRRMLRASSETSVFTRATRCYIPEDTILHSHRRENLKSYIL